MKRIFLIVVLSILGMVIPASVKGAEQRPIRTMIIAGADGSHWWEGASDALKQILENSGMFKVDYAFTKGFDGDINEFDPDFDSYDLVVVNYGGQTWSEPVRKRFEKWVADGGGVVAIHSSMVPMADWKEWNRMIGMAAWDGRDEKVGPYVYWKGDGPVYDYRPGWAGYHGLQHETVVDNRAPEHPITKGLPPRWKHFKDEIYCSLRGPAENMEILTTVNERGKDEAVMWTVNYGKGRIFVDVQGHCGNDPNMRYSMRDTGYQVLLLRGAEWAATGDVTQPVPKDFPLEDTWTLRPEFKAPFHAK